MKPLAEHQFVSLIFPASCVGCGAELEQFVDTRVRGINDRPITEEAHRASSLSFMRWQHNHWCRACWKTLSQSADLVCKKCGASLSQSSPYPDRCALCHGLDLRFDKALAIGNYQGLLQELVIRMKNQRAEAVAMQLGKLLGYQLIADGLVNFDRVVAVPTHWWRRLKRGFCAAQLIADSVSDLIGVRISNNIVRTVRPTKKQGTLSTQGRFANVRGAFEVNPREKKLRGLKIILIDDVLTSGATTSEVARILKRAGAAEVYVAVVARGARVS